MAPEKLWQGLARDTLQVVSTDHCPFCFKEQKELGKDDFTKIPNGGPGIEHRLSLIFTGGVHGKRFSPNRFVEIVSTAPAKLFGLYPRKGTIAVGSDADLVIFNPNQEETISAKTHHMRVDYSMFEGIRIKGVPRTVLSRGRTVIDADRGAFQREAQRVAIDLLQERAAHSEAPVVHGPASAGQLENHILNGVVVHAIALDEADLRRDPLPALSVDFVAEFFGGDVENSFEDSNRIAAVGTNDERAFALHHLVAQSAAP